MPKKTKNDDRFLGDVLVVSVVVFSLIIATVSVLVPIVPPPPPVATRVTLGTAWSPNLSLAIRQLPPQVR